MSFDPVREVHETESDILIKESNIRHSHLEPCNQEAEEDLCPARSNAERDSKLVPYQIQMWQRNTIEGSKAALSNFECPPSSRSKRESDAAFVSKI
jgi:hypothetical protein